jgi:hypothetical protein
MDRIVRLFLRLGLLATPAPVPVRVPVHRQRNGR